MPNVYSRAEYMAAFTSRADMAARHRRYYAQFVSASVIARVVAAIGADTLRASTDEHFNDIALARWDMIARSLGPLPMSFGTAGDFATLGGLVCVAKEAARQFVEGAR